jgi:hypothetical protein
MFTESDPLAVIPLTGSFEQVLDPVNRSDCPYNGDIILKGFVKIRIRNVRIEMIIN